jgi:hypothetical protein
MAKFIVREEVEPQLEEPVEDQQVDEPDEVVDDQQAEEEGDEPAQAPSELVVTLGKDELDETKAPGWVKGLRDQNRQLQRELREARQRLNSQVPTTPALGPKPTLEECGWDSTIYEAKLAEWLDTKKATDESTARQQQAAKTQEQAWQGKLATYQSAKTRLGVNDFEDAEAMVSNSLDTIKQGIIVSGAKDAALMIYALGKNPAKLKELAAISDPVEFAFTVARMEAQMKVNSKRPATAPESRLTGDSRPSGTVNSQLERLRAEALKTNDYTKVNAYKAKLRQGKK